MGGGVANAKAFACTTFAYVFYIRLAPSLTTVNPVAVHFNVIRSLPSFPPQHSNCAIVPKYNGLLSKTLTQNNSKNCGDQPTDQSY